jgi:hypothetical protein
VHFMYALDVCIAHDSEQCSTAMFTIMLGH